MKDMLPLPPHFSPDEVAKIWRVPYQERMSEARQWAENHEIPAASQDSHRICLLLIDVQNTFCLPDFELFVAGRSGHGAVADNQRLSRFIYQNLHRITQICCTMDTHQAMQIFHSLFLIDDAGHHPEPLTQISSEDIQEQKWKLNPEAASSLGLDPDYLSRHIVHYTRELADREKYEWTIWPYHAMLGGIGHALVPAIEEAIFFHAVSRNVQPRIEIKGRNPLTEHYSALGPEVLMGPDQEAIAEKNKNLVEYLSAFDRVVVAGQAMSHCVAWTVEDLLDLGNEEFLRKIYLLDDCTSAVVVPGVVDFTDRAEQAFQRFASAGMTRVQSDQDFLNHEDTETRSFLD